MYNSKQKQISLHVSYYFTSMKYHLLTTNPLSKPKFHLNMTIHNEVIFLC